MQQLQTRSMYAIREDHLSLIQQIEDNGGELTPELEIYLELTNEEFESKAISYAFVCKGFTDTEEIIEKEIDRLQKLKQKAAKNREAFKSRLSEAMQQFGVEKITTPTMKLSFLKSTSVEILDEEKIPEAFIDKKVVTTISKNKIKEALKDGMEVPGAQLSTKQNLQIK